MANVDPPAISTPSRPRYSLNPKRSGTFTAATNAPNVAGFSPGGQVFEGYSYLSRSTSMSTSTRSRPKGLQSRPSDVTTSPAPAAGRNLASSPSSPHIPHVADSPVSPPLPRNAELPQRSKTIYRMPSSISTPELQSISIHPSRSNSESERLAEAVANLPHNPKTWLPSQVALYLAHVLGLVPRPVVEDVTAYVRTSRMGGRAFLRLSEKDLERQGLNLKWRKLMIEAVRKLRRDALRGRIWGYESGSLRWPKSAHDLEREEAEDDDGLLEHDSSAQDQDGVVRNSKTTSKLTLKRMRDSRKVKGMIQAFQTSPEKEHVPLSNLSIDAGYGQGYVRGQAQQILSEAEEKKLSLRRPLRPRRSTADFPWLENVVGTKHEDVEALLASLSEQEAQQLANELGINNLEDTEAVSRALMDNQDDKFHHPREASGESADDVMLMPTLTRHSSVEGDTSVSECSGTESEADLTQEDEDGRRLVAPKPWYGVLDEDVIRAILADEDTEADQAALAEESPIRSQLVRSHTTASIVRPSRPYRASLYTDDELAALDDDVFHTRTESSRELVEAMMLSGQAFDVAAAEPDFGTARLRSNEEKARDAPSIPAFDDHASQESQQEHHQQEQDQTQNDAVAAEPAKPDDEYIFTLPDTPARRATGSIRRPPGRKATFGSKRGKAVLSLLNSDTEHSELFASLPGVSMLRQKSSGIAAEDEEGWGGTLGRSSSRKSLNSVFDPTGAPQATFRKRGLDRVASEAEGEALHAEIEMREKMEREGAVEAEVPVDRYEETVLSEDGERGGMDRKASVEQRLSSLFGQGSSALADTEALVEQTSVAQDEDKVETVEEAQAEALPTSTVEEAAAVEGEPMVAEASSTSEVDAVAESVIDPKPVAESNSLVDEATVDAAADEPADSSAISGSIEPDAQDAVPVEADAAASVAAVETPAAVPVDPPTTVEPEEPLEAVLDASSPPADAALVVATSPTLTTSPPSFEPSSSEPKLLVPLTVLEPHPSGTGSIKKRSMVLVDRKRFESLARRMTDLESQLDSLDTPSTSSIKPTTGQSGLRDMFGPSSSPTEEAEDVQVLDDILAATTLTVTPQETMQQFQVDDSTSLPPTAPRSAVGWRSYLSPSAWASYLSSLNPYYSTPPRPPTEEEEREDELNLYALLGRPESDHERHLLSIGAIPAYMLGLGAGLGFVLVREVLGAKH
ncbi:uncharacterized protein SPSC_04329 [Sporisorium scitamineum]|uniref:SAM domain-containing protein n=1 Tax=Sporisorium scitamineum TaxID=49012 RepID=A0A0F7RW02_9BASI|nr:uncharacterized protein SPSC_04329 [Sporisorium scitamineum]CDR99284.1 hypothetical protein [Sporisorium scitamineum]